MPVRFEDRTIDYVVEDALVTEKNPDLLGKTNPETWNLMKKGYVVLRNYIPKDIIDMTLDSWKRMELDPEMSKHLHLEEDIITNSPEDSLYKSNGMYNSPFGVALHRYLWERLKSTIDLDLQETYSYTRKYHRGAYLKAHADRPSCEISATICLGYITDDNTPWAIWVDNTSDYINRPSEIFEDTQGIPINERKTSKQIKLEVGDVLLYQGPNVAHWRERFLGEESYHIFCHFYDRNSSIANMPLIQEINERHQEDELFNQMKNHFPLYFDGRTSRYHPKEDCQHSRAFDDFMSEVWNDPKMWIDNNKSDFVNRYREFKQVIDGKKVEDDPEIFKPKYSFREVKNKRQTPS